MYYFSIKFDFDPPKSALNQRKHGVSLRDAQDLWFVTAAVIRAKTVGEPRWMRIGKLGDKVYSCIYTVRGDRVRLISARRSREVEKEIYEKEISKKSEN